MTDPISIPPKRLYAYNSQLFFVWKWRFSLYRNDALNNDLCQCLEEETVFIGWRQNADRSWFALDSVSYDGQTSHALTFAGITLGSMSTYQFERLTNTETNNA